MAKLWKPFYSDEATGGFANTLFFKRGTNYGIVSKKKQIITQKSDAQHSQRLAFRAACAAWISLNTEQQAAWTAAASKPLTGFNLFVGLYLLTNTLPIIPSTRPAYDTAAFIQKSAPQIFTKTINIFR